MLDNAVIFDSRIAEKYSIEEAIVIANLYGWIKHNATNGKNFHEGRYWTYNSLVSFAKYFPFWSESKVKRVLIDLAGKTDSKDALPKHEPIIVKGNFNTSKLDRTVWYSFTDEFFAYLKSLGYVLNEEKQEETLPFSESDQMGVPPADKQYQLNKPKDKQEKENLIKESEIVDFWNENTKDYPKVAKVSTRVKRAIHARIKEGYTIEQIKQAILLMNSLGDFYKGKNENHWKADFLWIMQNTKGNFEKLLGGNLHTTPLQQQFYQSIIGGNYTTEPMQEVKLGIGEFLRPDGTRTYGSGTVTIPNDAPPRRYSNQVWINGCWTVI